MLIGYGRPGLIIPTVVGTSFNSGALVDGRPSSVCRIAGGTDRPRVRLDWPAATPIRIVAALGLTCPVDTQLTLTGRLPGGTYDYALGGASATQRVVELVDGSRAAWWVLPANNGALVGLQLEVDADAFDLGELVVLQGVEVEHEPGSSTDRMDPSVIERTLGGGVNTVARRTYRRLRVRPAADYLAAARGGALANGMDWERLVFAMSVSARVAVATHWATPVDLHRTAIYGRAAPAAIAHKSGPMYGSDDWTFEEIPPL